MTGRDAALRRPRMSTEGRLSIGFRDRPRGRRSAASLPVFERAVQKPPLLGVLCSVDEPRCHVTENKGIIILPGLVGNNAWIGAIYRVELVLSNISAPGRLEDEELLNGNDVNRVNRGIDIYISSRQPASREGRSYPQEVPLYGNEVHGVDGLVAGR